MTASHDLPRRPVVEPPRPRPDSDPADVPHGPADVPHVDLPDGHVPNDAPANAAHDGPIAARVRAFLMTVASYVDDLPEWFTCPPSVVDIWKYAREGAWTTAQPQKGFLRTLATLWACFAIAIACPAYLLVWSAGRPVRFAFCYAATTLIGTMLAQVPLLRVLVPPIYNIAPLF